MKNKFNKFIVIAALFFSIWTSQTQAATDNIEIAGWIPYWRKATGTAEMIKHLDTFAEVSPFGYTVKTSGGLYDAALIKQDPWPKLVSKAREAGVKVVPSVMWSDAEAMDKVLGNSKLRRAHIKELAKVAKKYDGIDIDYEGKRAETKDSFSLFLKELKGAIGKKILSCTIEARTPPDSLYSRPPKVVSYSNDYDVINKYCDRVRIMTYDQRNADIKLNKSTAAPYFPVSDSRWVEKVINLATQKIDKKKIFLGIPTYGYEFEYYPERLEKYKILWSFNPRYATDLAASLEITPTRNPAGELHFAYSTTTAATVTPSKRVLWWSDASAIRDKVELAKKLGIRGVAIFKIDGGQDPKMWEVLE